MDECIKREQVLKLLESAQAWGWSMNTLYAEMQALPAEDVLAIPKPENEKISDYLEPMKIAYALKSELMKLELRQKTRPKDISPLDYTIIFCLEAALREKVPDSEEGDK